MKVIKRVELPESKTTCEYCKSELSYNDNDIKKDMYDHEVPDDVLYSYIKYPVCHKLSKIN